MGEVFNIPERNFTWFKEQLTTLDRRAKRLGLETLDLMVIGKHRNEDKKSKFYNQTMFETFVDFPQVVIEGWKFVATIDHANFDEGSGNIVRSTSAIEVPEQYRQVEPACQHCNHKRRRRDTYLLLNEESSEFKQVGSTCLKDFTGHKDAEMLAKIANIVAAWRSFAYGAMDRDDDNGMIDYRWITVSDYLARCAAAISKEGFVSGKTQFQVGITSTANRVFDRPSDYQPSEADVNLSRSAIEWAAGLEGELNNYQHNIKVIANSAYIEPRSKGIAASLVDAFIREQNRPSTDSVHLGTVGEKLDIEVKVVMLKELEMSTLVKMVDQQGNDVTWFASNNKMMLNKIYNISAKVKKHDSYNGVKSTIVSHVKVKG